MPLRLTIHLLHPDGTRNGTVTHVNISSAKDNDVLLQALNNFASSVLPNCRNKSGTPRQAEQVGEMTTFGMTECSNNFTRPYASIKSRLQKHYLLLMIIEYAAFLRLHRPSLLQAMQQKEKDNHVIIPEYMGGVDGVTSVGVVSTDLANEPHTDVNDDGQSVSIWHESHPGSATNWFFMMPELILSVHGISYEGVAVELFHGICIDWDGLVTRHNTTVTLLSPGKHAHGTFFSANKKTNHGYNGHHNQQLQTQWLATL